MTIECVMESWWDNNFFVKLRRPRIVKILFFLTFCLIEALLVSSIYIGNNIVNESKKPDLTQQTKYTQPIFFDLSKNIRSKPPRGSKPLHPRLHKQSDKLSCFIYDNFTFTFYISIQLTVSWPWDPNHHKQIPLPG